MLKAKKPVLAFKPLPKKQIVFSHKTVGLALIKLISKKHFLPREWAKATNFAIAIVEKFGVPTFTYVINLLDCTEFSQPYYSLV